MDYLKKICKLKRKWQRCANHWLLQEEFSILSANTIQKIVKCIWYRNPSMLTCSVFKVPAKCDATKKEVTKIVRKESALLCSKRSLLQMMSVEDLLRFRWSYVWKRRSSWDTWIQHRRDTWPWETLACAPLPLLVTMWTITSNQEICGIDKQVTSMHALHMYAAKDRVDASSLPDDKPVRDLEAVPISTFNYVLDSVVQVNHN